MSFNREAAEQKLEKKKEKDEKEEKKRLEAEKKEQKEREKKEQDARKKFKVSGTRLEASAKPAGMSQYKHVIAYTYLYSPDLFCSV